MYLVLLEMNESVDEVIDEPKKMKPYRPLQPEVVYMFDELSKCIEQWETFVPKPLHADLVEEWKNDIKNHMSTVDSDELVSEITSGLLEAYTAWSEPVFTKPVESSTIHELMSRPQTEQRTTNWYTEFQTRVTASELYKIFGSPRERAILVLQKAGKLEIQSKKAVSVSRLASMNPFDWGICLEPVVKLILESNSEKGWDALIQECGRFVHPTDSRFAASPDGLILRSKLFPERAGHLLEIKCPKSRKIGVKIPMEYYYQMQLQLEVTGVRACEYVEVKFELWSSLEESKKAVDTRWQGFIAVVGCFCETREDWLPCKYVYGPLNDLTWKPDLGLNEQTLELNVWTSSGYHHETVYRDEKWFKTLLPKLEEFWIDVERAKRGEFVLPESRRKKTEQKCMIVEETSEESSSLVRITKLEEECKILEEE